MGIVLEFSASMILARVHTYIHNIVGNLLHDVCNKYYYCSNYKMMLGAHNQLQS